MSWIFASLHVSFGFAIIGAIVGEFVGARYGHRASDQYRQGFLRCGPACIGDRHRHGGGAGGGIFDDTRRKPPGTLAAQPLHEMQ